MTVPQLVFGIALILILLGVTAVTAWKQVSLLRGPAEPGEDPDHLRPRAWRRLACSVLTLLLALQLAGALLFLEEPAQELANQGPIEAEKPEHHDFVTFYNWYWIVFLLILLILLLIALVDLWIVRRHGRRLMDRLREDRRAMIERQSAQLREERRRRSE